MLKTGGPACTPQNTSNFMNVFVYDRRICHIVDADVAVPTFEESLGNKLVNVDGRILDRKRHHQLEGCIYICHSGVGESGDSESDAHVIILERT